MQTNKQIGSTKLSQHDIPKLPKAEEIVAEVEKFGLKWHFDPQFDINTLTDDRVQVRDASSLAPKVKVEQYSVQMRFKPFPPVVITADRRIVDGNTRIAATKKIGGGLLIPAIIIDVDYTRADEQTQRVLTHLGAVLNSNAGEGLNPREVYRAAKNAIEMGAKPDEVSALSAPTRMITQIKNEITAAAKLGKVNLEVKFDDQDGKTGQWTVGGVEVKPQLVAALGKQSIVELMDQPYKELAELAAAAQFSGAEVNSLAKAAKETGSESGMLEAIRASRVEHQDRIDQLKWMPKPQRSVASVLRLSLAAVAKLKGAEDKAVETNPDAAPAYLEALDTAITVLTEVRRIQSL